MKYRDIWGVAGHARGTRRGEFCGAAHGGTAELCAMLCGYVWDGLIISRKLYKNGLTITD